MKNKKTFQLPIEPDPCPELLVERGEDDKGVGKWVPEDKHTLLAKMIDATRGARKQWPNLILIDPFCGPGRIQVKGESFTRDGGAIIAWRQSCLSKVPFTKILIGDIKEDRARACEARLKALGAPVEVFVGPAAETVKEMRECVPHSSTLSLAYLDPYNLKFLYFSIIEDLSKIKKIDFAVHFSTMNMIRNVDMELDPNRARFDETAPGWRDKFLVIDHSKKKLQQEFFGYWMELVKKCDFQFSKEMPFIRNDSQHSIYRMVFFSRSAFPNGIWDDIAKSPNHEFDF
jgi:three-Cys-motif partner protein